MLKKAGIIVAGSAAALLALSPLAFAGEGHHHGGPRGHHNDGPSFHYTSDEQVNSVNKSSNSRGLIAVGDVNALNNLNVCPSVNAGVGVGDILGILAPGTANVPGRSGDPTCVNDNRISQGNFDD